MKYFIEFKDGWFGQVEKIINHGPSLEVYGLNYPRVKNQIGNSVPCEEVISACVVDEDTHNSMRIVSQDE